MDSFAYGKPHASLSRWVERYVGYRVSGVTPGVHRGLPSRHPTFIVAIGDPIDVIQQTDVRQPPGTYRAVLSGLQPRHALIASGGREEGVAIEMTPAGFRALFGLPAAELWNATFELSDVTGALATELWERLQEPAEWAERFAICDEVLGRQIGDAAVRQEVERAWNLLVLTAGNSSIGWVAGQVGLSRQGVCPGFG